VGEQESEVVLSGAERPWQKLGIVDRSEQVVAEISRLTDSMLVVGT
jgi:hypothetical protein